MSLTRYSFTQIASPSANFNDDVLVIKQRDLFFEQGFNFHQIDALSGVNDATINGYSSMYLTRLCTDEDVFDFKEVIDTQDDYITYINYNFTNSLYFDEISTLTPAQSGARSFSLPLTSSISDKTRTFFEIETFDANLCRIKRRDNGVNYYLVFDEQSPFSTKFYFTTSFNANLYPYFNDRKKDAFSYILDEQGYLTLFKKVGITTYMVGASGSSLGLYSYDPKLNTISSNTLFNVKLIKNTIKPKLNTSWVSYETGIDQNELKVNSEKSVYDINTNNVCHIEYNNIVDTKSVDMNIFKTKNLATDRNVFKRANVNIVSDENIPSPFFREYTSLFTGNNEEVGYKNLVLNYVCYNQDYQVKAGATTEFTTPSSMFPFERININDTSFVKDGALASLDPTFADKLYRLNTEENDPFPGTYLMTWLSGGGGYGMWVDRFYFPNANTILNGELYSTVYEPTSANPITNLLLRNKNYVAEKQYVDVISNFSLNPNRTYAYERVSDEFIRNYVLNLPGLIQYDFSGYYDQKNSFINNPQESLTFLGDKYITIPIDIINNSGSFTVAMTLEDDWKGKNSQIFGSLTDTGFGIYNDDRITPFLFTRDLNRVDVHNTNASIIYSLSFDSDVIDVITTNHLQPYYVTTTEGMLYKISPDGVVKTKYDLDGTLVGGYLSYTLSGSKIAFLRDVAGVCVEVDTNTGFATSLTAVPFLTGGGSLNSSIAYHNNNLYLFQGDVMKSYGSTLYNLVSNSKIERYNLALSGTKEVFVTTESKIIDFDINNDGDLYILHNRNRLAVVNKERRFISDTTLFREDIATKIDFVSQYTSDGYQHYPVVLARDIINNYKLYSITPQLSNNPVPITNLPLVNTEFNYDIYDLAYSDVNTDESTTSLRIKEANLARVEYLYNNKPQPLINYNNIVNSDAYKYLNFKIILKNIYDSTDVREITHRVPLTELSEFSNDICVSYNNEEGRYFIIVNKVKIAEDIVDKSKYTFNLLFSNSFRLGSTGFINNVGLDQFVNISGYNFVKDMVIKNFKVLSESVNDLQLHAINLDSTNIQDIFISLPCGQRNNIEEIQNMFKFTQPYSKSNSINIIVKNSQINNSALEQQIVNNIYASLDDVLPADVSINNIRFINY